MSRMVKEFPRKFTRVNERPNFSAIPIPHICEKDGATLVEQGWIYLRRTRQMEVLCIITCVQVTKDGKHTHTQMKNLVSPLSPTRFFYDFIRLKCDVCCEYNGSSSNLPLGKIGAHVELQRKSFHVRTTVSSIK